MVLVVAAKPYPAEHSESDEGTSIGQKLWISRGGAIEEDFDDEQLRRIHLENFLMDDDGHYRVATRGGYLLTATGHGTDVAAVREELIGYVKDSVYVPGMKVRTDIGRRVEGWKKP